MFECALVTGASDGIGKALAYFLARQGVSLILVARSKEKLKAIAEDLQNVVMVKVLSADLGDRMKRQAVVEAIHQYAPDLVVNNAGWGYYGEALSVETEKTLNLIDVDVSALTELTIEAARMMVERGKKGVIMNISSSAAYQVFPLFSAYAAAKAFVNTFSESFDFEMRPYGIAVLTSCPGMVATEFGRRAGGGKKSEVDAHLTMSVDLAVEAIWKQIVMRKAVHIFDWRYRIGVFLSKFVLPKRWVAGILRARIEKRLNV